MAFKLASAYVEFSNRGLSGLMGGVDAVKGKLAGLASFATGPLGVALAGLGAGAGVAGMIKLAADAEQTEVAFATMLGGADRAKKMIGDLRNFAAATPFEFSGISQATKTLLAFGTEQENVLPLLQMLGDVSAGTGKDLAEMSTIFGKIAATGRLTGGELGQLTDAGVPMLKVLGQQLGRTEGEIKKMVEAGEIDTPKVIEAFQSMSAEGGMFENMMGKQSTTVSGLFSTLKDSVTNNLTTIGTALIDGLDLKGGIASFSGFLDYMTAQWIPSIVSGIQWVGANIIPPMAHFISWSFGAFGSFVGWFASDVWPVIVDGFSWTWSNAIEPVYNFVSLGVSAVKEMVDNFDLYWKLAGLQVVNFAVNGYERIKTFFINIPEIAIWAMDNFRDIMFTAIDYVLTIFINLGENIRSVWSGVLSFIAGNGFEVDFKPLTDGFRSAISEMPQLTKANLNQLQPEIDNVYQELARRQAQAMDGTGAIATASPQTAGQTRQGVNMASYGGGTGPAAAGSGSDRARFVGISQLAEQMQTAASQRASQQKQVELATSQADSLKRLLDQATGEGLKISNMVAKSPIVNWAFGGGDA